MPGSTCVEQGHPYAANSIRELWASSGNKSLIYDSLGGKKVPCNRKRRPIAAWLGCAATRRFSPRMSVFRGDTTPRVMDRDVAFLTQCGPRRLAAERKGLWIAM